MEPALEPTIPFPDPAVVASYQGRVLEYEDLCELLPHRPPFLLVDRVTELEPGVRAAGHKCLTIGEPFFAGHFPSQPVMPGVLMIEALAQISGIVVLSAVPKQDYLTFFTGIDGAKFRRQVRPGDVLRLEATLEKARWLRGYLNCRARMEARVDGELACEANGSFALVVRS